MFFGDNKKIFPVYEAFVSELISRFPKTKIKVQKTQISFSTAIFLRAFHLCASEKRRNFWMNILCLLLVCRHRLNLPVWQQKQKLIPGGGQPILLSAVFLNLTMNYLTW